MTKDKKDPDNIPDKFKHVAGQTAIDERDGKTVRGWENIDDKGHAQGHGDEPEERKPAKGH